MGSWLDLIELDLTADGRRLGRGRRGDYFLFGGRNFYPTWDEGGGAETEWRPWEVLWTRRGVRVRRVVHEDAASLDVELPRTSDVWLTGRVANGFAGRVRIVLDGPFLVLTPEHRACVLALDLGMAPPGLRASHSAAERDAAVRRGRARTRDFIARRDADVFFAVPLGRFASRTIGVGTAAGEGGARHRARMGSRDFLPLRVAGSASWDAYMEREVPELTCDDDSVARAYAHSFFILKANRIRYGKAPLVRPHTMPSRFWYTNQWWWDSSFHMAGQRWLADKAWAHHELDNFLHHQWPNGMIPAELHVNRRYGELWFKGCRDPWASSYTINPVPAWLIHKVWQVTGDRKCLARWLPPLVRYHDWYLGCRLDRGLLFSDDTFEVQDDSPRYDALRVRGPTSHGMRRVHVIETNAFFCLQARALSRIARVLGKRALSARLAREGDEVAAEMKRRLWDPAAGLFFDRTVAPDRAIPVRVNAAFFPLLLDVLDARERAVLLRHFRNPREFGTRWPLPTVAASAATSRILVSTNRASSVK